MKKLCRRKHYALMNPVALAIEGACITPQDKLDKLRLMELAAIDALASQQGTLADLRTVTDMMNLAETMASIGIGPEATAPCATMQSAVESIMVRCQKWGMVHATPAEIEAMRDVFGWHDLQRQSIARSEYERAITLCGNRIRSKHPSAKVLV